MARMRTPYTVAFSAEEFHEVYSLIQLITVLDLRLDIQVQPNRDLLMSALDSMSKYRPESTIDPEQIEPSPVIDPVIMRAYERLENDPDGGGDVPR